MAVIGTGGSISTVGHHSLDQYEYGYCGGTIEVDVLLAMFPEVSTDVDLAPVRFRTVPSTAVGPRNWLELNELVHRVAAADPPPAAS